MSDALKIAEALARTPEILVIDDDDFIRLMFNRLAQRYELNVTCASTPQNGLGILEAAKARNKRFDVVFLDIKFDNSGGIDGMDVLRQINANDSYSDCHVVVMSGSVNMHDLMHQANKLGVLSFMHKPIAFTVEFLRRLLFTLHIRVVERPEFTEYKPMREE